jgi:hypothetical protein
MEVEEEYGGLCVGECGGLDASVTLRVTIGMLKSVMVGCGEPRAIEVTVSV